MSPLFIITLAAAAQHTSAAQEPTAVTHPSAATAQPPAAAAQHFALQAAVASPSQPPMAVAGPPVTSLAGPSMPVSMLQGIPGKDRRPWQEWEGPSLGLETGQCMTLSHVQGKSPVKILLDLVS